MRNSLTGVFIVFAAAAVMSGPAWADDDYDIKVYPCPRASGPITVDGALDEPVWQAAPLVTGFTWYNKPDLLGVQAYFRVLYDDDYLHFGVVCDEPNLAKLTPVPQPRDTHAVFETEAIEIFVEPKHDGSYFQFAANAAGSTWDSRGGDNSWDAAVVARTRLDKDKNQWTLEFAIPWKDLGVRPAPGRVVGFNVCRDRYLGGDREWSNWSQTQADFHDPDRFAHLVLSATPEKLGQLGAEFRKGGRHGRLVIYSNEGFADTTYRATAREALAKIEELLANLDKVKTQDADEKTRAELDRRLQGYRDEIAPFREQVAGRSSLDAAAWMKVDLRVEQLTRELDQVIWEARLTALLSSI